MAQYIVKTAPDKQAHVWYLFTATASQHAWTTDASKAMLFRTFNAAIAERDRQIGLGHACFVNVLP